MRSLTGDPPVTLNNRRDDASRAVEKLIDRRYRALVGPTEAGSPWLEIYEQEGVDTLRRVTVEGAAIPRVAARAVQRNSGRGEGVLGWEGVPLAAY